MVPNNLLDYQWSEELQVFCKETCPHDKDYHHCIGLCVEAQARQFAEFRQRHGIVNSGDALPVVHNSLPIIPCIEVNNPSAHMLVVYEINGFQATKIAEFDLVTEEREQFLPEWRSIGETRAMQLKK